MSIISMVESLYPFSYSVVSEDSDRAVGIFQKFLPFSVLEVPSGAQVNGWTVPPNWKVVRSQISLGGKLLWEANTSPFGVGVLSPSFSGTISREELKEHLFFSSEFPEALPYYWSNLYRPSSRNWAFCVTREFHDSLPGGDFLVELETEESPGKMNVLDYFLPGDSSKTILLNAHNCHPWQANDDISGCAVGIAVMQELAGIARRRFSYRLVIGPELIGTAHWLDRLEIEKQPIVGAIMLKAVGHGGPLKLQHSFAGDSQLDKASELVFSSRYREYESGPFRTIYGNDETVFDSPGFEIPSISITRFPFPGYHTDLDKPGLISEGSLQEAKEVVLETLQAMERNLKLRYKPRGLVSLSHPMYDLYKPAPAPGIDREEYPALARKWNLLMNCLPRELDGTKTTLDIAKKYSLPVLEVAAYLDEWVDKGLAEVDNQC